MNGPAFTNWIIVVIVSGKYVRCAWLSIVCVAVDMEKTNLEIEFMITRRILIYANSQRLWNNVDHLNLM